MSVHASLRQRRTLVLTCAATVLVLCLVLGAHLGFENDIMRLLPTDDPVIADYLTALTHFQSLDYLLFDISSAQAPSSEITGVAASLSQHLASSELIGEVHQRIGLDQLAAGYHVLRANRANLFSAAVQRQTADLLDRDRFSARCIEVKKQLLNFPDPVSAGLFRKDPLGIDQLLLGLIPTATGSAPGSHIVDGWMTSSDGTHVLVLAQPRTTELDSGHSQALEAAVDAATAASLVGHDTVRIAYLSRYRAALDNERTIKADIRRTLWLSLGAIIVLLGCSFSRLSRLPLLLLPAVLGGAVGIGALAVVFGKVSPVVIGCGSIVLGISIDYAIHLVFRIDHDCQQAVGSITRATARPVLLAAVTTAVALLSLLASDLPGHRQLGVFASSGVLAAAAASLLLLPPLLARAPRAQHSRAILSLAPLIDRALTFLLHKKALLVTVALLISAVALPGLWRVHVESDLSRFNAMSKQTIDDSRLISETWGSPLAQTSFVVRSQSLEHTLQRYRLLTDLLEQGQRTGTYTSFSSAAALLPDAVTQAQNRQRWQDFWSPERLPVIKRSVNEVLTDNGFAPPAFAVFWSSLALPENLLTRDELNATPIARLLSQWLTQSVDGTWWALARATPGANVSLEEESVRLKQLVPGLLVADGEQMMQRLSSITYAELKKMSLLSFALVCACLLPFFRQLRQPFILVLVLVVTFGWTLGMLGWMNQPINMMNCMLAIFLFGLTIDYAIFLLHALDQQQRHAGVVVAAVVLSSMTTMIGFGALLFAHHPSLHSIGVTTMVGVACGLVASLTIVPALAGRTPAAANA